MRSLERTHAHPRTQTHACFYSLTSTCFKILCVYVRKSNRWSSKKKKNGFFFIFFFECLLFNVLSVYISYVHRSLPKIKLQRYNWTRTYRNLIFQSVFSTRTCSTLIHTESNLDPVFICYYYCFNLLYLSSIFGFFNSLAHWSRHPSIGKPWKE